MWLSVIDFIFLHYNVMHPQYNFNQLQRDKMIHNWKNYIFNPNITLKNSFVVSSKNVYSNTKHKWIGRSTFVHCWGKIFSLWWCILWNFTRMLNWWFSWFQLFIPLGLNCCAFKKVEANWRIYSYCDKTLFPKMIKIIIIIIILMQAFIFSHFSHYKYLTL